MILEDLAFDGLQGIKNDSYEDARGSFSRVFDRESLGVKFEVSQAGIAVNAKAFTLRGMHFQSKPYGENKLVLCTLGTVQDVVINLNTESPNYLKWKSVNIGKNEDYFGLLIPNGFAHGYLTLSDDATLLYFMDQSHVAFAASGLRWNDPKLGVKWLNEPKLLSQRDQEWPYLEA